MQVAALDASTDGHNLPPRPASKKKPRQSSLLDHDLLISNRQMDANAALAEAFYSAGIAPNVLDNSIFQRALRKIALVGNIYDPPGRRAVCILLPAVVVVVDVYCSSGIPTTT